MLLPGSRENERRLSVIFKIASRKKVGILLLLIITTIVVVLSFFAVNRGHCTWEIKPKNLLVLRSDSVRIYFGVSQVLEVIRHLTSSMILKCFFVFVVVLL
ncbi:uncharacterized protein A4U43_C01F24650 [Asparagus officinalis]|uniref:Uncharacterized protein n=1 Tax=Asparagus officinalis TaxID=4686 RepID=A0A5P1FRV6_ASPOF|nr:uncharacterized protein A4U43_C01F24650 [Asparagus officinalis]